MNFPSVVVTAPSRLHFGLLSFGNRDARQYGGVGLMIDQPALRLRATPARQWRAAGPACDRVDEFARRFCQSIGLAALPACELTVETAPPAHCGLGSGTQLGLAVAAALERVCDLPVADTTELARRVGRGERSAIGVHGFFRGGLLVEAGKLRPDEISPLVARVALPETWRVALLRPRQGCGLSGEEERRAFDRLPATSPETTARLCDEVLRHLLPAAREGDFGEFSQSIYRYGRMAGSCFAAVQAGREFATLETAQLVAQLRQQGVAGVGQSSWGPTVFAFCEIQAQGQRLVRDYAAAGYETTLTALNQRGATVETIADDTVSDATVHDAAQVEERPG